MTKISSDDLEQAAMWLEECDPSEASVDMRDSCIRVAAWLRQEAERRAARKIVNIIARELAVTPATVRRKMKTKEAADNIRRNSAAIVGAGAPKDQN